eukprot:Lankesteria_metandrocarpae@DN8302_c0_g1_i1.p1
MDGGELPAVDDDDGGGDGDDGNGGEPITATGEDTSQTSITNLGIEVDDNGDGATLSHLSNSGKTSTSLIDNSSSGCIGSAAVEQGICTAATTTTRVEVLDDDDEDEKQYSAVKEQCGAVTKLGCFDAVEIITPATLPHIISRRHMDTSATLGDLTGRPELVNGMQDRQHTLGWQGEQFVRDYLNYVWAHKICTGSTRVVWVNEKSESGLPYDLRVEHYVPVGRDGSGTGKGSSLDAMIESRWRAFGGDGDDIEIEDNEHDVHYHDGDGGGGGGGSDDDVIAEGDNAVWRSNGLDLERTVQRRNRVAHIEYVEVKCTTSLTKSFFEISHREWQFAQVEGSRFSIYRVVRPRLCDVKSSEAEMRSANEKTILYRIKDPYGQWRERKMGMCLAF